MATWLKIEGGIVTQGIVMRDEQDMTHIAALGLDGHWVQSDTAGIGWGYAGGDFTPPVAPVVVPQTITRRQGRLALLQAGKLDAAEAIVKAGGAAAATGHRSRRQQCPDHLVQVRVWAKARIAAVAHVNVDADAVGLDRVCHLPWTVLVVRHDPALQNAQWASRRSGHIG